MIDIAKELEERFEFAAEHYLSAWEHDPDGMIDETTTRDTTDAEQRLIDLFEKLRDTIGQIPAPMIQRTQELYEFVGPQQFEDALGRAIQGVGWTFTPTDASDFVKMLDLSLSFLQAA